MQKSYYTVDQIAKLLGIHPKTIQRYIREGKLTATKFGKSYRVSGHDLSRFTEGESIAPAREPTVPRETTKVSSVVDISVVDTDEAVRIVNALTAAMNCKPSEYGASSMHTQYIAQENTLRITLWGNILFMSAVMEAVKVLTEQGEV